MTELRGVTRTLDPFKAYMIYMGLKAHFNSNYDYVKYGGKTSATRKSYLNRKDKAFFGKASRKFQNEVEDFFISNFVENEKGYVGQFNEETYIQWKKRVQSLKYQFKNDMTLLLEQSKKFNKMFECKDGQHPILFKNYLAKKISIETMVILDRIVDYAKDFDTKIHETVIWPSHAKRINNYKKLLTFDESEYKMILFNLVK